MHVTTLSNILFASNGISIARNYIGSIVQLGIYGDMGGMWSSHGVSYVEVALE